MPEEKERQQRVFRSTEKLKQLMAGHFHELADASTTGARKIAWCTSVGPVELLRGMGFLVYFPENHAAMLGASRMATELIPHANAIGYSPDICSYLTSDIGSFLRKRRRSQQPTRLLPCRGRMCSYLTRTNAGM